VTQAHMRRDAEAAEALIWLTEGAGLVRMHPRTLRRWIEQRRSLEVVARAGQFELPADEDSWAVWSR
jgi:hypothetical protein